MVRSYKRQRGSRQYLTAYPSERMDMAVRDVHAGIRTTYSAAREYKVPYSTLYRKLKKLQTKHHGGQIYLGEAFEKAVVEVLNQLSDWKVPLTTMELRLLVKNYLDLSGIKHSKFHNNLPGRDWARKFMKRHGLLARFAAQIQPGRAKLNQEDLEKYFEELRVCLEGVDPSQIYNFDETNFTDDPSRKKCIVRRHAHRHEILTSYSKQAFSVMFCGSATGVYLPPMIVYKANNLYDNWTTDGINGATYASTESGWFNMATFEQWFFQIFLPHVKDLEGPKVLIGDNLSSHFSPDVVASCLKHNIRFKTLLPNSTHICQPLDVAVFRPMKVLWRQAMAKWRIESRNGGTIPKETFPRLLARVFAQLENKNLVAGFKASGIVPLDINQVINRIAGGSREKGTGNVNYILNEACLTLLRDHCGVGPRSTKKPSRRGKKILPGKTILAMRTNDANPVNNTTVNTVNDTHSEVTWVCAECFVGWEDDGDRWIVCDKCDKSYHLQCSGVQYRTKDYYDIDIESMYFDCSIHK